MCLSATVLAACGGEEGDEPRPEPPRAAVQDCRDRAEGPPVAADPERDTTIGPVTFLGAKATYRDAAARRGEPDPPLKVLARVRAGKRVTLEVPPRQRRWMRLLYREPGAAVTLVACRRGATAADRRRECGWAPRTACRSPHTEFAGGFALDFDRAPARGRCAALLVHLPGREAPLRRAVFGECPSRSS